MGNKYNYRGSKYKFDYDYFYRIDDSIKAYWLGVLMADGYIDGKYKTRLAVSPRDANWLYEFRQDLNSDLPIRYSGNYVYIQINSIDIVRDLAYWGIFQGKTGKEIFSPIWKEYYPDFIRGIFDGDGCARVGKDMRNSWQPMFLLCGSKKLMEKTKDVLMRNCDVNDNRIRKIGRSIYDLRFVGTNQVKRIYDYVYYSTSITCLKRKRDIFDAFYVARKNE